MWRTLTPALTLLTATTLSDAMPAMDLGAANRQVRGDAAAAAASPYSYGDDDLWWAEHAGYNTELEKKEGAAADTAEEAWQKGCDEDMHGTAGALYRGCQSKTKSGKTCQNWKEQDPHKHDRFSSKFPGTGLKNHNYCRNPDNETTIWCYTTDPDTRWEYCEAGAAAKKGDPYDYGNDDQWSKSHAGYADVKAAAVQSDTGAIKATDCDEALGGENGSLYRGCQTKTKSGATCQNWKKQKPHAHDRFSANFPGTGIKNHNYCRNPDKESAIWCYTTNPDLRWEYCEPMADTGNNGKNKDKDLTATSSSVPPEVAPYSYGDDDAWWAEHVGGYDAAAAGADTAELAWQKGCDEEMHGTAGALYRGCQSKTKSGKTCQNWKLQDPHKHDRFDEKFPGTGLKDHNYCRNPDKETTIWCYTTDPETRWEYCEAPTAKKGSDPYDYGNDEAAAADWLKEHAGYADIKSEAVVGDTGTKKADECNESMNGSDGTLYRGCQTKTKSGATCQNWKKQTPHSHDRFSANFPGTGIKNHNYCRNPDKESAIWCYTTNPDLRWEYCEPMPEAAGNAAAGGAAKTTKNPASTSSSAPPAGGGAVFGPYDYGNDDLWGNRGSYDTDKDYFGYDAKVREPDQCDETLSSDTQNYRGCQTKTRSGKTCQKWDEQTPHAHDQFSKNFAETALLGHNYCRNPDGEATIWCYTTEPDTRWEFCDPVLGADGKPITTKRPEGAKEVESTADADMVPYSYGDDDLWWSEHAGDDMYGNNAMTDFEEMQEGKCDESYVKTGFTYRGCQTKTKTGKTCQKWDIQTPHAHDRFSSNFPGAGLKRHNYCRNPDNETAIWCYTTDPDTRWEYCAPLPKHSGGGAIHLTEGDVEKQKKKHKGDIISSATGAQKSRQQGAGGGKAVIVVLIILALCGALFAYRAEIKDKLGLGEAEVGGGIGKLKGKAPKYERVAVN